MVGDDVTLDTDQATLDRWLAAGKWEQFAPGVTTRCNGFPERLRPPVEPPADWEPQPCTACNGRGYSLLDPELPCRVCEGVQRLAVTVPHRYQVGLGDWRTCSSYDCPDCGDTGGRITVAWATVEWGPLPVVKGFQNIVVPDCLVVTNEAGLWRVTGNNAWERGGANVSHWLPSDIDPASLIGQFARGGTITITNKENP